jgi:hypothetical protein
MDKVTINKVGETPPVEKGASRRKTARTTKTFPKGILKIKPVGDPAKAPPIKKTAKRQTIQILTEKGAKKHRKTVRRKIKSMSNDKVKQIVEKHGLVKSKGGAPPSLMRHILEGGVIAGFISLD